MSDQEYCHRHPEFTANGAQVVIELGTIAPRADWISGRLADRDSVVPASLRQLRFGSRDADNEGFARIDRLELEDGSVQSVLTTHPQWATNGTVKGFFPSINLPENAVFTSSVGFAAGSHSSGVRFQVWEHHMYIGKEVWSRVADFPKVPSGQIVEIVADLSHLSGQNVRLELRVDTGDAIGRRGGGPADSGQDWAIWLNPKIESLLWADAHVYLFAPTNLAVEDEGESTGDDPYFGYVYYRSTVARPGSTVVSSDLRFDAVGDNLHTGRAVPLHNIHFTDAFSSWIVETTPAVLFNPLSTPAAGLTMGGLLVIGVEEDADNRTDVRVRVEAKVAELRQRLRTWIELAPSDVTLAGLKERIQSMAEEDPGGDLGGGGGWIVEAFKHLPTAILSPDDLVGYSSLNFLGVSPERLKLATARFKDEDGMEILLDALAVGPPEDGFQPILSHIRLLGEGSSWKVSVVVNEALRTYPLTSGY